ncbi:hypothetical protein K458DRAFT_424944 [Lentithecium fluviatile CBS 122367]|uniref:Uncharacterized protein n=1 Tax=Lentithecium fluviatile CBS 122367 TaxID=1168545 RepID=A0A6G1IE04_9PLEO|nr:hypothetical protein K458DRAFT_424944 [Lentithecium fluviatile CBS 122367]
MAMDKKTRGYIVLAVILFGVFIAWVASKIHRKQRADRRYQKHLEAQNAAKAPDDDVELGQWHAVGGGDGGAAQLPTDKDGGEDMERRVPIVHQLDSTEVIALSRVHRAN